MRRLAALAFVVGLGIAATTGLARGEGGAVPMADLAVVSRTADVSHAKVGDDISFTVVATNNGPDAAELDVLESLPDTLAMVSHECDRGISADGPFCEYGTVQPGETLTTRVVAVVVSRDAKRVTSSACVLSEEPIVDVDASNDCASTTERIVGSGS